MSARPPDERLLELLCARGRERAAELARLRADAAASARLAELEGLLERARRAAGRPALAPQRGRALVERILAATTREDLSRRGDLRLQGAFLRARLRESPALRLVAASLATHLLLASAAVWALAR